MFSMSGTILAQKNVSEIVLEFKDTVYTIEGVPPLLPPPLTCLPAYSTYVVHQQLPLSPLLPNCDDTANYTKHGKQRWNRMT